MAAKTKIRRQENTEEKRRYDKAGIPERDYLMQSYKTVRDFSFFLSAPLETEDFVIQSMPDVSPTKWHLAHTSWFFETFVLSKAVKEYRSPSPQYAYLFNSYYIQAGERHLRPKRGLISRPTVRETFDYRRHVDEHMMRFFAEASEKEWKELAPSIEIGIHHEQQHQELIVTDIKHVFSENPLRPAYSGGAEGNGSRAEVPNKWVPFGGGIYTIGHEDGGFGYDNEYPSHKTYLEPFKINSRLVTNREYMEFMDDGGYENGALWLSEAWAKIQSTGWNAPFYWERDGDKWRYFTLSGMRDVDPDEPVCHVSYFEADAFARWAGARLPTEAEWEVAAGDIPMEGNFVEEKAFHPVPASAAGEGPLIQMYGDVWEWTQSAYTSYPGFKTLPGALGEYNGKFMCNQFVLRGGSCATSGTHIRKTYRNFFPPDARWQFMGIRLASDV
ncbi:MAG: ergothioneine biosynthesis protein EgtB [Candidatus Dadabacteria bacterium]